MRYWDQFEREVVSDMDGLPRVCVAGVGSAGAAVAADLALAGFTVSLFDLPEFSDNLQAIDRRGGIELTGTTNSGKIGFAEFEAATLDPAKAVQGKDVIMVATPAFGHEPMTTALAPYLESGQIVMFNTGYWGSLRVRGILEDAGKLRDVVLAEAHIHPYLSRSLTPTHAHIYAVKQDIRFAAWPATETERALSVVRRLYPQMRRSSNVLETNFYAGNPSWHAPITIPKASFFFDRAKAFRFYGEVSPSASRLIDAFDSERQQVAAAFGCRVPTLLDWISASYGLRGQSVYEAYQGSEHAKRWGTDVGNRRVLREDLCYFYHPMEQLADKVGVEVPVTRAMIDVLGVLTDYDYRQHGVTLADLGMSRLATREEIRNYLNGE